MEHARAVDWTPPPNWRKLTTIESHTGGEPFRVVVSGQPDIPGGSVLQCRRYARAHLDGLRRAIMWEPRGHADMYGCFLLPPFRMDSDLGILFIHNEGFSTMCGHGIIALVTVLLETGMLPIRSSETRVAIDTPAGQVVARATISDGTKVTRVTFRNVASFAAELDAGVSVPGLGDVTYDLGFGGAFYAYVDAASAGVDLDDLPRLIVTGRAIKKAIDETATLRHPEEPDLEFLYGVIFTAPAADHRHHSRNVCVFADGEIDRSPTGTGVSGRLAILRSRGEIQPEDTITVESIVGSTFDGRVVEDTHLGDYPAVIPEVSGEAFITGRSELWIDPEDTIGEGFFLR